MRKVVVTLAIAFGISAFSNTALACSCIGAPIERQFQDSFAVFIAEMSAVQHNVNRVPLNNSVLIGPGTIDATFKVTRAVKGSMKIGDSVTVRTSDQESACGFEQWLGQKDTSWIIYAYESSAGLLQTGICSRSRQSTSPAAAEDLAYFDSLKR